MAKNKPASTNALATSGATGTTVIDKPKKTRGPRGVKLALPANIQGQLNGLPDLYPKLKSSDVQARFLANLGPSLDAAYQAAFEQLVNDLESERSAKVSALRGAQPAVSVAPDPNDPNYVAIDSETPQ